MGINENIGLVIFVVAFILYWGLWLLKLYNVMSKGKAFDARWIVLTFIGVLLSWGLSLICLLAFPTTFLSTLVNSESYTLPAVLIFFVVECMQNLNEIKMMFKTVKV